MSIITLQIVMVLLKEFSIEAYHCWMRILPSNVVAFDKSDAFRGEMFAFGTRINCQFLACSFDASLDDSLILLIFLTIIPNLPWFGSVYLHMPTYHIFWISRCPFSIIHNQLHFSPSLFVWLPAPAHLFRTSFHPTLCQAMSMVRKRTNVNRSTNDEKVLTVV